MAAVIAALGWLACEYWRRNWRREWFAVLGLLSSLGLYSGIGGRVVTSGVYGANIGGGMFLSGAAGTFLAALVAIGFVLHRIAASPIGPHPSKFLLKSGTVFFGLSAVVLCCVVVAQFALTMAWSLHSWTAWEDLVALPLAIVLIWVVSIFVLLLCLTACAAVWALLFYPADRVKSRPAVGVFFPN
ncbi:MAG: hypothetical protein OXI29_05345 [bacterium]|nr:hypothetical protein [bacterium]